MARTILETLFTRLNRYETRYGGRPSEMPVTLDEWALLSEAILPDPTRPYVTTHFAGVPVRLVQAVYESSDGVVLVQL